MNKISTPLGVTIIIVIAFIVGAGILIYQYWWLPKQETPPPENPSIIVLSPNGGEVLEVGKTYEIKWNSSYPSVEKVTIALQDTRYSFDSESPLGEAPIAVSIPNSGNYDWEIPASLTDRLGRTMALGGGNIYKLTVYLDRIGGECKAQRCDVSDAPFSIATTGTPFITVLSPNGGETLEMGKTYEITWNCSAQSKTNAFDIYIKKNVSTQSIMIGSVVKCEDERYTWKVGEKFSSWDEDIQPGITYKIQLRNIAGEASLIDESDASFSIVSASIPSITVLSPNGGESWQVGKTYHITWSSSNLNSNYQIYVDLVNSTPTATGGLNVVGNADIVILPASTNDYYWTVPSNIPVANDYKIQVAQSVTATNDISDTSDAPFSIE